MPGRIIMEHEGAIGSQDLKKDRSNAQKPAPAVHPPARQAMSAAHANGPANGANGVLPNGVPTSAAHHSTTNGENSTVAAVVSMDNPPELDLSWQDGPSNKPLGLLMQRLANQSIRDLTEKLSEMSNVPTEHPQPNGVMPHTGQDTSKGSIDKKKILMGWAQEQRERFIKTLVLADWSRNIEDKRRLVDVKYWQGKQIMAHDQTLNAIAQIKRNMGPAKLPNPNIEGAMEVLATGKASWIPHMGYLPPKRLTAKQLLKTLRNLNVILATRLNLHEELPPHFTNFTIADGRVTFTVQDEFEVDLAVADEDPESPFYFIDIRLGFTPAPAIIGEGLYIFMERKVNAELASKGLKGCYDFLHSFSLTHKINTLRSQAFELARGLWFDCIRIEHFRRRLIVQYWANKSGLKKSWIEIGINNGKRKGYHVAPPTPQLAIRWFRRGEEVKDETLEFDWRNLDMEKSLRQVIAKHTSWIMNDLKARISHPSQNASLLETSVSKTDSESSLEVLSLDLPSLRQPLQAHIEPITGQFTIVPPSQVTRRTEYRLNTDSTIDFAKALAALPCAAVQERNGKEAALIGWSVVQHTTQPNDLQKLFDQKPKYISVYRPSAAWGEIWSLAITFSPAGEKWWAVLLTEHRDNEGKATGKTIASASHIELPDVIKELPAMSREMLLAVGKAAVAQVGFTIAGKQLKEMQIPHSLQKMSTRENGGEHLGRNPAGNMAMFVKFSELMKTSQNKTRKPWADEIVRLTHHGLLQAHDSSTDSVGIVRHDLRLSVQKGLKELQKHVARTKGRDLVMNSDGGLAMRFLTKFGGPFVQEIQQQLRSAERLESCLATLKKRRCKCTHVSLSRLDFSYGDSSQYSASLTFGERTRLKLSPLYSNPHQRIRVLLENILNGPGERQFEAFLHPLAMTILVLKFFDQLETKYPAKQTVSVHPRAPTWYTVRYATPLPSVEFQVIAKRAIDGGKPTYKWFIHDVKSTIKGASLAEDLTKALKELFAEHGERWQGIGNAIVTETSGIASALERVDDVVRRFQGSAEASSAKPVESAKEAEGSRSSEGAATSAKAPAGTASKSQSKPPATTGGRASAASNIKKETEVVVLD